jgi:hypothetical protein
MGRQNPVLEAIYNKNTFLSIIRAPFTCNALMNEVGGACNCDPGRQFLELKVLYAIGHADISAVAKAVLLTN